MSSLDIEIVLQSGNKLRIGFPPVRIASKLLRLFNNYKKEHNTIEMNEEEMMSFLVDEEAEKCLLECASYCVLNNQRITEDLFSNIDYRKDYIEILSNIFSENLKVFFTEKETTK